MIVVLNTGCANIGSILSMYRKIGVQAQSASNYKEILTAKKLILPGVGHFDTGMRALKSLDMIECLKERVVGDKVPILGVCLGMQLMCISSEEGATPGLGWVEAKVRNFRNVLSPNFKIPHMGWNNVTVAQENPFIAADEPSNRFYFVHSFFVECASSTDVMITTRYGIDFTSGFMHGNIFGVQFHPEKSHRFGMNLLKKFAEIPC